MLSNRWPAIARLVSAALILTAPLRAQSSETSSFVTLQGKDTVAIEQFTRTGNTITGAWIQHQGGVYVHDYALVLGADGWPAHYVMTLYTTRPHTFLMSVTYGPDSATRILVRDSVAQTERVAAQKAYPTVALSLLGVELALIRARAAHADSSSVVVDVPERRGLSPAQTLRFVGNDSASIGTAIFARVDHNGRVLALHTGRSETVRVPALDVAKLTAGFYRADSIADAARVEIVLPPAALQRFVGEYAINPTVTLILALEDGKLMAHVGAQPAFQLLAQGPTTFFLKAAPMTVEFDVDSGGKVTGLTLIQGGARQRAAKMK